MDIANPYQGSGDTGSGELGVNLDAHIGGNPIRRGHAPVTVGHTWLIIIIALVLLWLFGGKIFKSIRMG